MKVRLLHFAVLRDIVARNEESLEVAEGARARDVWEMLRTRHDALRDYAHPPMVAINEAYADADTFLREGDELAFIPPVAGG